MFQNLQEQAELCSVECFLRPHALSSTIFNAYKSHFTRTEGTPQADCRLSFLAAFETGAASFSATEKSKENWHFGFPLGWLCRSCVSMIYIKSVSTAICVLRLCHSVCVCTCFLACPSRVCTLAFWFLSFPLSEGELVFP